MASKSRSLLRGKSGLHPRNRHRAPYDFAKLAQRSPSLAPFVRPNAYGNESIDFADPSAVKALNQALLREFYKIEYWDIPDGYLCPPIPGRADYIHTVADLVREDRGGKATFQGTVTVLDIGVGANCVFPIIGAYEYGWRFVGSEIDPAALKNARQIVAANRWLSPLVECRQQPKPTAIFSGVISPGESFDLTICNPPFHASRAEAIAGTKRKVKNLQRKNAPASLVLNFGGQAGELWCAGGEISFVDRMIVESRIYAEDCGWFSTLVSKSENLRVFRRTLARVGALEVRVLPMQQGQKQSRVLAWTFRPKERRLRADPCASRRPERARS